MTKQLYLQYANEVLDGTIPAPLQVRKQAEIFLKDYYEIQHQNDAEFYWDYETEEKIDNLLDLMIFARGALAGKSIGENFAKWQAFAIYNTLCWKLIDTELEERTDVRRYKTIILTMARKQSKSVLCAIIHILTMILDGENAYHYLSANNESQAAVVFKELVGIIKASKALASFFKIQRNKIFYSDYFSDSEGNVLTTELNVLSGDSKTKDGLFPYVFCCDEMGAKNSMADMYNVLASGQTGVLSPLQLLISTSYPIKGGVNYWQNKVQELIDNTHANGLDNPQMWGLAYVMDEPTKEVEYNGEIVERWTTPEAWLESNPLAAEVSSIYKSKRDSYVGAKRNFKDLQNFKIKELNIWLDEINVEEVKFVTSEELEACEMPELNWEFFRGKEVIIGADFSKYDDNTSISFQHYDPITKITYIKDLVVFPKNRMQEKIELEGLPYDEYVDKGYAIDFGGNTIDLDNLGQHLHENYIKKYGMNVFTIMFDQAYAHAVVTYFKDNRLLLLDPTEVHQTAYALGSAVAAYQKAIKDGEIRHDGSPLFVAAHLNMMLEMRNGRYKPAKSSGSGRNKKIDSAASAIDAYTAIKFTKENGYATGQRTSRVIW